MSGPDLAQLAESLRAEAMRLGFGLVGITPAVEPLGYSRFVQWLEAGYAGELEYLQRRREAYRHPQHVLEGARTVVMLGLDYNTGEGAAAKPGWGRVSRYAWGAVDYHDLIWGKLSQLEQWLTQQVPGAVVRGVVDTAPLLEREFAQLAGLGWQGKNTMLINRRRGSYFFLAALLTDLSLPADGAVETDHCGTCRRCLEACPTQAFPQPYVLDASRCLSYLTIELRSAIPTELRSGLGDWLFGCDICQEVCPWNRFSLPAAEEGFQAVETSSGLSGLQSLVDLLGMGEEEFRQQFRRTPLWRPRRRGILRNAAIVLGNQRHAPAVPVLVNSLNDTEELVRGAAAWALGQIGGAEARAGLLSALSSESSQEVRAEVESALSLSQP